jgi:hypothetical protein
MPQSSVTPSNDIPRPKTRNTPRTSSSIGTAGFPTASFSLIGLPVLLLHLILAPLANITSS